MADYTYNDMLRMQEEAARRVREMKKRAALAMDEDESFNRKSVPLPDDVKHYSMPVEFSEKHTESVNVTSPQTEKTNLFNMLTDEKDVPLILAVIYLLMKERTDYLVLLALVYILM